jgi:nucleoside-triphosphatase THEP1
VKTKALILLTGARGIGKSTVCQRLVALWRERGGVPAGLITRTVGPERYLVDVATGEERLLAAEDTALAGPRRGKFSFSEEALVWGNEVVRRAVAGPADLVLLDEVGPLELVKGAGFLPALEALLGSEQDALVVVRPGLLEQVQAMATGRTMRVAEVTVREREVLPGHIARLLTEPLRHP